MSYDLIKASTGQYEFEAAFCWNNRYIMHTLIFGTRIVIFMEDIKQFSGVNNTALGFVSCNSNHSRMRCVDLTK